MTNPVATWGQTVERDGKASLAGATLGSRTVVMECQSARIRLSDKPLTRPVRMQPLREITSQHLSELAGTHRPPQCWYDEEIEYPF